MQAIDQLEQREIGIGQHVADQVQVARGIALENLLEPVQELGDAFFAEGARTLDGGSALVVIGTALQGKDGEIATTGANVRKVTSQTTSGGLTDRVEAACEALVNSGKFPDLKPAPKLETSPPIEETEPVDGDATEGEPASSVEPAEGAAEGTAEEGEPAAAGDSAAPKNPAKDKDAGGADSKAGGAGKAGGASRKP